MARGSRNPNSSEIVIFFASLSENVLVVYLYIGAPSMHGMIFHSGSINSSVHFVFSPQNQIGYLGERSYFKLQNRGKLFPKEKWWWAPLYYIVAHASWAR